MAVNDVKVIDGAAGIFQFRRDDRDTGAQGATVKAGEPVKRGGAGSNFAILLADGDPEIGTDFFLGIAARESTETATADGRVDVWKIVPDVTRMRARVTTTANMDADSELLGILFDCVAFDYLSQTFTVDENQGDEPTGLGLQIMDGDPVTNTLVFIGRDGVTGSARLTVV